jgi:hypothetical protein
VLAWLYRYHRHVYEFDAVLCAKAARGGHLHTLQWLRQLSFPWSDGTVKEAYNYGEKSGDWSVLRWAMANGCPDLRG